MTKKHYVAIARTLRAARLANYLDDKGLELLAENMADTFADDNPRFDRERFLFAAGVTS